MQIEITTIKYEVQYNAKSHFGHVHLEVRMKVDIVRMFIYVVRDYTILHGKDMK